MNLEKDSTRGMCIARVLEYRRPLQIITRASLFLQVACLYHADQWPHGPIRQPPRKCGAVCPASSVPRHRSLAHTVPCPERNGV